ncbi:hypothetical protein [uncultured Actinomyces sp.]|uniref:hypothetical protein n=1 Tax=uncultured Actinomyces sp. TaxID=249061 RepID=UPI00260C8324|nr:hypothetical protein [uncultured Actinomyces sp.]
MTHMTHTLRQPAHAAAACAGLALLLGACAPTTPFARPTPTPTASSPTPTPTSSSPTPGPTPTPAPTPSTSLPPCDGQIVTIDETGQFQPFGSGRPPSYVLAAVRMEDGIMKASLSGGYSANDVPDGHVRTTLIQGEPFYAPHAGTFTLLDGDPAPSVDSHGSATLCFEKESSDPSTS